MRGIEGSVFLLIFWKNLPLPPTDTKYSYLDITVFYWGVFIIKGVGWSIISPGNEILIGTVL